jgi:hypothetical protein
MYLKNIYSSNKYIIYMHAQHIFVYVCGCFNKYRETILFYGYSLWGLRINVQKNVLMC